MQKSLRDSTGIWFSELKDKWEEKDFYYDSIVYHDGVKDDTRVHYPGKYRCYGDLPDGSHFGVWVFPSMIEFADFRDPPFTGIIIVDEDGYMQASTLAEHMHWKPDERFFPMTVALSPTGRTLVWITEGELWVWHMDLKGRRFWTDEGETVTRLGEHRVQDALMQKDGVLKIVLEDGETFGFFCDEDVLLTSFREGWVPAEENDAWQIAQPMDYWPDSLILMIRKEDEGWKADSLGGMDYNNIGVRRVCFEPGLEIIKRGILAMNDNLEAVVIPDHVMMVESSAFLCCTNLTSLTIEGDLSRVANWDKDAFEGCPCEDYYHSIRNGMAGTD